MKTSIRLVTACLGATALVAATAQAQLSYNFNLVPKAGEASFPAWPFYYWSYFNGGGQSGICGGLAWRWAGSTSESPAEKFDKAFGYASKLETAKLDAFGKCAWNAKARCVGGHRVDYKCIDSAEVKAAYAACKKEFTVDSATEHEVVYQGCGHLRADKWWGICHGAAPATVLFKEPTRSVTYNGVTFQAKDIQGLLSAVATGTVLEDFGWAGCRNDGEYTRISASCPSREFAEKDVTPKAYHAFFGHFLGTRRKGFVADVSTGPEVWNQGVDGYETNCTAGGTGCAAGQQAYTCRGWFRYSNDMWTTEVDNGRHDPRFFTKRNLAYTLCVKDGVIVGDGTWNHDPNADKDSLQPDFLWAPKDIDPSDGSNPYISGKARDIIDNLAKPSAGQAVTPPTPSAENTTGVKNVNLAIPDNNSTGVSRSVKVGTTGKKFKTFSVCLNIAHTYRGDLLVTGTYRNVTATFWNKEGGSEDDINTCISTDKFIGLGAGSSLKLKVVDTAAQDVGTWKTYEVKYSYQ